MTKYCALAVSTSYWKPNINYLDKIAEALEGKVEDGDFVVVSEKAISTAVGNIVEESLVKPSHSARLIARFWMRFGWGFCLGVMCRFGQRLLSRLREYPRDWGSRHKQVALERAGLVQALMFGSEGGIDGSNLPYSYVSLPLKDAAKLAQEIQDHIKLALKRDVCVLVADTDKTYKFYNFYFTPRPTPLRGIYSAGGVVAYVTGRFFMLKKSSTPLAVAGYNLGAGEALKITNIADRARGAGAGATVWDMAARFGVDVDLVSWSMLEAVRHKPLVIVRKASFLRGNK